MAATERHVRLVVVGGGPAGLALAIEARLRSLDVVVLEAAHPPVDKACGEGLMPGGVALLRSMGVEPAPDGMSLLTGVRYVDHTASPGRVAEASFPHGTGLGIRRLHLHQAMVERATALGAELRFGEPVVGLDDGEVRTERGSVRGDLVVGADGLHSTVRRLAGLEREARGTLRFGVRRHYAVRPWSDRVEVHWGEGCEAYLTPVGPRRLGVAFLWTGPKARYEGLLERFPAIASQLLEAVAESSRRGAGPLRTGARAVLRGRVALIGDAAGYVDAITGEGLSLAFHEAKALAALAATGRVQAWPGTWRRLTRLYRLTTLAMLGVAARPWLRRRYMAGLEASPALFAWLLGLNDGVIRLDLRAFAGTPAFFAAAALPSSTPRLPPAPQAQSAEEQAEA